MSEGRGIRLQGLGYTYPAGEGPALAGIDLEVNPGEICLLTGPTGCGKSTLLRMAAGLLERHGQGQVRGEAWIGPLPAGRSRPSERVLTLGFVSQEPGDQLVAETIEDELAFGAESACWSSTRIEARIPELLERMGLDLDPHRSVRALSGGQQQRVVVAAALSAGGQHLLLDEPLAQLDPVAARGLLTCLRSLADAGHAILLVEHRLEACLPSCDRLAVMEEGRLSWMGEAADPPLPLLRRLGLTLPGLVDLKERLGGQDLEAIHWPVSLEAPLPDREELVSVGLPNGWCWPGSEEGLGSIHWALGTGERVALVGGNGAGKSTLLGLLSGRLGNLPIQNSASVVEVPQDSDLSLFSATVREELAHGPREQGLDDRAVEGWVSRIADVLSLTSLLDRPPQALSRGQRLRVAVGAGLACRPSVLLLDEPTAGQDRDQVEAMLTGVDEALGEGTLVFATHDLDLALRHASRVVHLEEGLIVGDGPPVEVLGALNRDPALFLPPLARFCLDRGLAPATAEQLAAHVVEG